MAVQSVQSRILRLHRPWMGRGWTSARYAESTAKALASARSVLGCQVSLNSGASARPRSPSLPFLRSRLAATQPSLSLEMHHTDSCSLLQQRPCSSRASSSSPSRWPSSPSSRHSSTRSPSPRPPPLLPRLRHRPRSSPRAPRSSSKTTTTSPSSRRRSPTSPSTPRRASPPCAPSPRRRSPPSASCCARTTAAGTARRARTSARRRSTTSSGRSGARSSAPSWRDSTRSSRPRPSSTGTRGSSTRRRCSAAGRAAVERAAGACLAEGEAAPRRRPSRGRARTACASRSSSHSLALALRGLGLTMLYDVRSSHDQPDLDDSFDLAVLEGPECVLLSLPLALSPLLMCCRSSIVQVRRPDLLVELAHGAWAVCVARHVLGRFCIAPTCTAALPRASAALRSFLPDTLELCSSTRRG